jgi:hypothetical protein
MTTMKKMTTCGRREMRALYEARQTNVAPRSVHSLSRDEVRAIRHGRRDSVAKLARAKMFDAFKAKMLTKGAR